MDHKSIQWAITIADFPVLTNAGHYLSLNLSFPNADIFSKVGEVADSELCNDSAMGASALLTSPVRGSSGLANFTFHVFASILFFSLAF